MKKVAIATLLAGALSISLPPAYAQEAAGAETEQTQEWQNPERIADIQDQSERIRAYSVLIGQSVYDEMLKADDAASGNQSPEITAVNIVDVTEALTPEDVRRLEAAATENEDNIKRLQSYLELEDETRTQLEEEDVLPADVVGVQLSENGVLDLLVVPGWLTE